MELELWPACVKAHGFAEQLRAAASAGFDSLSIGPATYKALRRSGLAARHVAAMAADHGVRLGHYDGFSDWAPVRCGASLPAAARAVFDVSCEDCLAACSELGLPSICATAAFAPGEVELAAMIDAFGAFCERARAAGVRVDLEFIPMWGIPDLRTAWGIVGAVGASNAGVLLDTWHFFRGAPELELLQSLPPDSITAVQLADAPRVLRGADLFEDCLRYRLPPGEGELALDAVLRTIRDKGGVASIGPEVFSDALDELDAEQAAHLVAASTRRVLADAQFEPDRGRARATGRT